MSYKRIPTNFIKNRFSNFKIKNILHKKLKGGNTWVTYCICSGILLAYLDCTHLCCTHSKYYHIENQLIILESIIFTFDFGQDHKTIVQKDSSKVTPKLMALL